MSANLEEPYRRAIRVHGVVQGVGFRPFVRSLAVRHELGGFVRNETWGVAIEVEGKAGALENFLPEAPRIGVNLLRPEPAVGAAAPRPSSSPRSRVHQEVPMWFS